MATESFLPFTFAIVLTKPQRRVRHLIDTKVSLTFSAAYIPALTETEMYLHIYPYILPIYIKITVCWE